MCLFMVLNNLLGNSKRKFCFKSNKAKKYDFSEVSNTYKVLMAIYVEVLLIVGTNMKLKI